MGFMLFLRVDACGHAQTGTGAVSWTLQPGLPAPAAKINNWSQGEPQTGPNREAFARRSVHLRRPNGPQRSTLLSPALAPASQLLWSTAATLIVGPAALTKPMLPQDIADRSTKTYSE